MRRLFLLAALTLPSLVLGASSKASQLAKDADRLYKENKYKEAAETLRQAYDADPTGLYLYNIARAYDQAAELELSQEYYRKYVALPSDETQPDLVKKANLAMDRIRTLLARGSADKQVRDAEKQRLEEDARKAEARADAEAAEARKQRQEFAEKERARKEAESKQVNVRKLVSYGTGGAAIVGLGMALSFGIASNVNRDQFRQADTLATKQQLERETRGTAAVADVTLIIGLAAAVATVIIYPKGEEPPAGSVNVVLAPVAGGGGVVSAGVRF